MQDASTPPPRVLVLFSSYSLQASVLIRVSASFWCPTELDFPDHDVSTCDCGSNVKRGLRRDGLFTMEEGSGSDHRGVVCAQIWWRDEYGYVSAFVDALT